MSHLYFLVQILINELKSCIYAIILCFLVKALDKIFVIIFNKIRYFFKNHHC